MQKRESNDRVEDDLRKKLRETEKKLAAEKAEQERLERERVAAERRVAAPITLGGLHQVDASGTAFGNLADIPAFDASGFERSGGAARG